MNWACASINILLLILIDSLLTSFLTVRSDFEIRTYLNHSAPADFREWLLTYRFNFFTGQLEFILLTIFRAVILLAGLAGIQKNQQYGPKSVQFLTQPVFCLFLILFMYSPLKLLALCETSVDISVLKYFWALSSLNELFSILGFGVWCFVLAKIAKPGVVSVALNSNGEIVNQDNATLLANDHLVENGPVLMVVNESHQKDNNIKETLSLKESTSTLKRLWRYCLKEWLWYMGGFTFLFLYSAARMFIPYFTGRIIQSLTVGSYDDVMKSILDMALLSLASAFCSGLRGGCFTMAINRINVHIRSELFNSLVHQEIGFFDVTKTGEITSRLTADCQTLADTFALNVNVFLRNIIMFIGSLAIMLTLSWQLTLSFLIVAPMSFVVMKAFGRVFERLSKETQDCLAKANDVADEVLGTMRTVRSFANEAGESRRYDEKLHDVFSRLTKRCFIYTTYITSNELAETFVLISTIWYGAHLVLNGRLSTAILVSFLLYEMLLGETVYCMGLVYSGLMDAAGASKKVFELIDRMPKIKNDGELVPTELSGRIEFKNVAFAYPSRPDVAVLKDISFTVEPGEIVALVGPSGGGKSSCIALLEHFYEPTSGEIQIDGISVDKFNHAYLHRRVALVGQEPVLYARSVSDNVAYGLESGEYTQDDVEHAARLANAHSFVVELSGGYSTDVGEKGAQISGGQKQRVAIARAVIRKPKVLLLDEATSALDAESEYLVQQALYENLAGYSILLIAHRLSTVKRADKIVVIDQGRVVEQGKHEELVRKNGLYKNLVERQLLGSAFEETASN